MSSLAAFISPHGFGHAARCSAILAALRRRHESLELHIYTLVPEWFFSDSLGDDFHYHPLKTDVGLIQRSPVEEDLPATVEALDGYLPFRTALVDGLARELDAMQARMVICDIAPLGIVAARAANRPSVLVENFTWDWIYRGYEQRPEALDGHIEAMSELFASADHHIQTRPVCDPRPCSLTTSPICRRPRLGGDEIRHRLGIDPRQPTVLLTMGGIPGRYDFLERLASDDRLVTIAPGTSDHDLVRDGSLLRLPHHGEFFHPDLVAAVDVVVGKLGYSTVAEAFHGGRSFAWVGRPDFRESPILARFVSEEIPSVELSQADFLSGDWIEKALALARRASRRSDRANGADEAADYLSDLLA